nr:hypothetical protein [Tanacetum cinerariifolium]
MAFVVNSVLAYGVDLVLDKEFASFALQVLKIHSLMNQLRILTMILQTLSTYHHSPRHTLVSYVETIITTADNLSTHTPEPSQRFNSICYDDDDDYDYEESTIPLNEIISQIPSSMVINTSPPVLLIEDSEVSLIMGNKLSTLPEKKSYKVIKSSVEDLVPIPSKSEDTSGSDSVCILPSCDDFSPINIFEEKSVTFSNPLINSNDDFTSSDDESLSDEDVLEDNVKIYLNPLFKFDDEYISSDVNPLFDEVLEDIECKDSYDSNLDESTFLVTPLSDSNEDEYFTPGDDVELLLHRDPSTPIMNIVSILEGLNPFVKIPYGEIKIMGLVVQSDAVLRSCDASLVDFQRVVEKVKSLQLLEVMVVRHFGIEVVIVVERLFFSKLVLPRFVVFLRSLEGDIKKTLRIKNRRDEE